VRPRPFAPAPAPQRTGPPPTGEVLDRGGDFAVCLGRSFTVAPDEVWAWLTDPDRLRIWLGEAVAGESSAAERDVLFRPAGATYDGPALAGRVVLNEPAERLRVAIREGRGAAWRIDVRLAPTALGTHLVLEQTIADRVSAPTVAAACEFYLDRLVRVCHGQSFGELDHDDYFLAQGPAYRRMFPLPRRR
jgi:uncharacterized protein YndB with AHSA1/START domain